MLKSQNDGRSTGNTITIPLIEERGPDKTYIAKICLGKITNTLDTEGQVIKTKPVPKINVPDILTFYQ